MRQIICFKKIGTYPKALNMKTITRIEEIIMLSILNLGENAYLVAILDYVSKTVGKNVSLTSVQVPDFFKST